MVLYGGKILLLIELMKVLSIWFMVITYTEAVTDTIFNLEVISLRNIFKISDSNLESFHHLLYICPLNCFGNYL